MRFSRESQMSKTLGQWLRFPGKAKKPNFWQHFCNYWMNQIFPGKSGFVSRSAILSCNFMPSFGKILWPVFKKSSGLTDEGTDGRTNEQGSIYRTNLQCRWVQKGRFFSKIRLHHFSRLIRDYLHAKNLRNPMVGSMKILRCRRTDRRTDRWSWFHRTMLRGSKKVGVAAGNSYGNYVRMSVCFKVYMQIKQLLF
jgi:hypothetical protein